MKRDRNMKRYLNGILFTVLFMKGKKKEQMNKGN